MTTTAQEQIYEKMKEWLTEVIGERFIEEYDVTMDSTLSGDLEMESIEIVELSEKIMAHYGDKIKVSTWLAELNLESLVMLTVGDVVNFIDKCIQ